MFFLDKYKPKNIRESHFHKNLLKVLETMSKDDSIPHIIFHGPSGCGKKTIIRLLLELLYDETVNNTVMTDYVVIGSGNKASTISIKQSNYHIVIEPNNNNFDKHLVTDIMKEYAKKAPLDVFKTKRIFKTVLINNIDSMSYYAQTALRRTMEKHSRTCRFIMWCHSLSKVIDPLKSRCICFNVPSPSESDMFTYLFKINVRENMDLNFMELVNITEYANGNIKKALWKLQMMKLKCKGNIEYYDSLRNMVNVIKECNVENIFDLRESIYNIMITNMSASKIITDLLFFIVEDVNIGEKAKCDIIMLTARTDYNLIRGRREIINLENYLINVMDILSKSDIAKIDQTNG